MQDGDVQIYDPPARSAWKSPLLWVVLLGLMAAFGVYFIPSLF